MQDLQKELIRIRGGIQAKTKIKKRSIEIFSSLSSICGASNVLLSLGELTMSTVEALPEGTTTYRAVGRATSLT